MGPKRQCRRMKAAHRRWATAIYLLMMIITVRCSVVTDVTDVTAIYLLMMIITMRCAALPPVLSTSQPTRVSRTRRGTHLVLRPRPSSTAGCPKACPPLPCNLSTCLLRCWQIVVAFTCRGPSYCTILILLCAPRRGLPRAHL